MGNIFDEIKKFEKDMEMLLSDFMNPARGIEMSSIGME